jgi:hypothetical protein
MFRRSTFEGYEPVANLSASGMFNPNTTGPSGPNETVAVTPDINTDPTLGYDSSKRDTSLPCNVDSSGKVCPEGTFCDGPTRSCIRISAPVDNTEIVGYYS